MRSVERLTEYEPGIYIERISPMPLMMVVGAADHLTVAEPAVQPGHRRGLGCRGRGVRGGDRGQHADSGEEEPGSLEARYHECRRIDRERTDGWIHAPL